MSADPTPTYRRLPGGGFTWKGHGRAWLAQDHLLEMNSLFISESYQRFFFQEIRAFVIQRTKTRQIWGWLSGSVWLFAGTLAGVFAWSAYANRGEEWHIALYFPAVFLGLLALASFVLWILNLTTGPSCVCQVLTSTGWHALSAPRRLGPAIRAQAEISGLIQAQQGLPPVPAPPPAPAAAP